MTEDLMAWHIVRCRVRKVPDTSTAQATLRRTIALRVMLTGDL
jgi:hypothetical protein